MNKVYIVFPLIGLLIFGGFYLNFSRGYADRIAQAKVEAEAARKAKFEEERVAREKAMQDAIEAAKRRELERLERDRIAEAKATARQEAEDRRLLAKDARDKLRTQRDRLTKELADIKETFGKIEEDKQHELTELNFLKTYVQKASGNVQYYATLLEKINDAERKRAEAAAEAARAAAAARRS